MSRFLATPGPVPLQSPHLTRSCNVAGSYSGTAAQEVLCTPGLLHSRCSARCCLRPRGLVSHSPLTCTDAWLARRSTRSAVTQTFPFSGLCVRFRASTLHLAEPPLPKTVVPGGWIDLTREGFCYAENFGILSFSVVAQSLVNWPYGMSSMP